MDSLTEFWSFKRFVVIIEKTNLAEEEDKGIYIDWHSANKLVKIRILFCNSHELQYLCTLLCIVEKALYDMYFQK